MKKIIEILNIDSMDQTNKDLFENVKQYEQDSPKSVKSNCSYNGSANGEGTQKKNK